ncbi:hypothetical protein ODE01S_00450 [Oceanithermus desulfurans NBRC 100063]|uniref:Uncharacterized protein n=2 Tax=Oceanithermus desulfurans TaxID=227924 RepID=A0A511RG24_9DEIN|nr:hypothetical protein ODE01S_00450 [Oceanithermus desulfurans NBRC 100063]
MEGDGRSGSFVARGYAKIPDLTGCAGSSGMTKKERETNNDKILGRDRLAPLTQLVKKGKGQDKIPDLGATRLVGDDGKRVWGAEGERGDGSERRGGA